MSLWPRSELRRERAERAALKQRVNVLQTAVDACKGAGRWLLVMRPGFAITIAVALVALGFALGVYSRPLKQAGADLIAALGLARSVSEIDAAEAAYEKRNYATALSLSRPLAEQGDARAQALVGLIYYRGQSVTRNDKEAVQWFRRAADQRNASAQFYLGVMSADGHGVPQDYTNAANWYRLAAEQGHPQAQYNLGLSYADGEGVPPDIVSAHMWLNLAATRFPASDSRKRSAITARDLVGGRMTPQQLAQAQKLAREWQPK
jgi:TPR repeat protein